VVGSVLLGGWLEIGDALDPRLIFAAISALLLAAFGYAHNDFCDQEVDRVNKAHRPLPRAKIEGRKVLILAYALAFLGLTLGSWINSAVFALASVAVILLLTYNLYLKKSFLWGNFIVSFLSGGLFVFGAVAVNKLSLALVPAIFSFLFHLGRELLKDLEDHQADRQIKASTFPLIAGTAQTRLLVTLVFLLLILMVFVPYFLNLFNSRYLILTVLGVDWFLLYILWSLWKDTSPVNIGRLNALLKINMYVGLTAILVGRL
jgi:geranylgeranylglycerol-phosphate geranylgeranyltransferase